MAEGLSKKFKKEAEYSDDNYNNYYGDYEDEQAPSDYYCIDCKATMNSLATWQMHVSGRKHQKTVAKASFGTERRMRLVPGSSMETVNISGAGPTQIIVRDSCEVAQMQRNFEEMDEPVVGLDHVKEIWLQDRRSEPLYKCTLCGAGCQVPTIRSHVTGYRHRMAYIQVVDPQKHKHFSNSSEKTSVRTQAVARAARRLQEKYGMGTIKVIAEVDDGLNDYGRGATGSPFSLQLKEEIDIKSVPDEEIHAEFFDTTRKDLAEILGTFALPKCAEEKEPPLKRMQVVDFFVHEKLKTLSLDEKIKITDEISKCNFDYFRNVFNFNNMLDVVNTVEKIHSKSK